MSDKQVTIKFWKVVALNGAHDAFGDALAAIRADQIAAKLSQSSCEIDGVGYELELSLDQAKLYVGDVIRLQREAFPSKIKKGSKAERLALNDGEHLGHHTGFIYDPATKVLGFEIKAAAAGLHKLLSIVTELSGASDFAPLPVIKINDMKQLSAERSSRLSFRISDPESLQAITPDQTTLRDGLIDLKEMADATYLNISVGVGRKKSGLERSGLMQTVGWLLGERSSNRGKIRTIRAHQPGTEEKVLDFINAQVKYIETLAITGDPASDWRVRSACLRKALTGAKAHVTGKV